MTTLVYRAIIVPLAHVDLARRLCAGLAGSAGGGMFTTGLAATSDGPATHYISAGLISAEFAGAMADPQILLAACAMATPPVEIDPHAAAALLAAAVVSDGSHQVTDLGGQVITAQESVHAFIARNGLEIVRPQGPL